MRVSQPRSARSVYELHVIDPTTSERHHYLGLSVIAELIAGLTAGTVGGGAIGKVTLEVVDVRSRLPVLTMRESPETATGLAGMITADLDRLDATAFATEWGIKDRT